MINQDGIITTISVMKIIETESEIEKYLDKGWEISGINRFNHIYLQRKIKLSEDMINLIRCIKLCIENYTFNNLENLISACEIVDKKFDISLCNLFKDISELISYANLVKFNSYNIESTNLVKKTLNIKFKKYIYD